MFRSLFLLIIAIFFFIQVFAQADEDSISGYINMPGKSDAVLLIFSGSDWCKPCMRLRKEVLDNQKFIDFAYEHLEIIIADFPQRKKLDDDLVKRNEKLAEKYNPKGFFPQIVLLDQNMELLAEVKYANQSTDEFILQIEQLLPEVELKEYKKRIPAMGSFFEFIVVESVQNENLAQSMFLACEKEVQRVENLISEWIAVSEVSMINRDAGIKPVQVSNELFRLIERSIRLGELTQGAFDITFHALDELWKFDGSQIKPPDSSQIKKALDYIGFRKIKLLDSNQVFLSKKGMSIGFGGIGQGYAVDRVRELLLKRGVENFVVNSSGDVYAHGLRADRTPWKVGVADPMDRKNIIQWLEIDGSAVVTSGNYEKYFEYDGIRYAHIINPNTGWPTHGIVSATVISPYTEVADALATAIFVLGVDVSLNLINQLPGTHCIIIDDKKAVYYSQDLVPD